jgi:hypothetical protein
MFKLNSQPTFKTTVTVSTPTLQGDGEEDVGSFEATFKILAEGDVNLKKQHFLDVALVDIDGVEIPDGLDKDAVIKQMRTLPHTRSALMSAYNNAVIKKNTGLSTLI